MVNKVDQNSAEVIGEIGDRFVSRGSADLFVEATSIFTEKGYNNTTAWFGTNNAAEAFLTVFNNIYEYYPTLDSSLYEGDKVASIKFSRHIVKILSLGMSPVGIYSVLISVTSTKSTEESDIIEYKLVNGNPSYTSIKGDLYNNINKCVRLEPKTVPEPVPSVINFEPNCYYYIGTSAPITSVDFVLPQVEGDSIVTIKILFTTYKNNTISIYSEDNKPIFYKEGFSIEDEKQQEITMVFNGHTWLISNTIYTNN